MKEEIIKKVKERAGKISTCHYRKTIEPKKRVVKKYGEIGKIERLNIFQVRAGIDYKNIKAIKEGHESGEIVEEGLPPSLEEVDTGVFRNIYKDKYLIGAAPVHNKNFTEVIEYYIDGEKINLDDIVIADLTLEEVLYANDMKSHDSDWVYLDWENIESLSGV